MDPTDVNLPTERNGGDAARELRSGRFGDGDNPIAYQALASDLREALASDEFSHGRPLPTEATLSKQYGVSRQTVRRAMQDLVADGLVFRVRGRGTFATPVSRGQQYLRSVGSIDDLLGVAEDTQLETVCPLEYKANIDAASRLNLPTDQVVTGIFLRVHHDAPISLSRIFLPPAVGTRVIAGGRVPKVGKRARITIIHLIDAALGQPVVGAHQSMTAERAPADVADQIGLEAGDPVLRIDRVYLAASGSPVELAISYYNPDRYTHRLDLRRSVPPA